MARADMAGFFWDDTPPPKPPKKTKPKTTPPKKFWEEPDYLPGLEEALRFVPNLMSDAELVQASVNREELSYDIEVYPNYCLFAFKSIQTGKAVYFELESGKQFDSLTLAKFKWVLTNFCLITFNGRKFDIPVSSLAVAGKSTEQMWEATEMLIAYNMQKKDVYKRYKVTEIKVDQIDLIELTALAPGLKVCAGRLHAKKMQDLPFKPGTVLSHQQISILRPYCINDLDNTEILYRSLEKQIELRKTMSSRFGVDLRSHSDAQMAEAIISAEIKRLTGKKHIARSVIAPGTVYKYQVPHFIKFQTPLLNHVLTVIRNADFVVDAGGEGNIVMPPELADMVIEMGNSKYKVGIGGLHSQEKSIAHISDEDYVVIDTDATSYYPYLILNAGIAPQNLGKDFLVVYSKIVAERVQAKHAGNNIVAECLKIVVNGTFGKLGSKWSIVYAPNLLVQVTLTGQLSILMLAERFELSGIEVTSVNTDGIVVRCPRKLEAVFKQIVEQWEKDTGFGTEETRYKATYSRDINNYIAVYETPQKGEIFKTKGAFAKTSSKKNAVCEICIDAVKEFMATGKPLIQTITECKDIRRFTSMRRVKGGGIRVTPSDYEMIKLPSGDMVRGGAKSGEYLGKIIRWYYAIGEESEIISGFSGNKVALTDGAKPCMVLPDVFPDDIDYTRYEADATKILQSIGYLTGEEGSEEDQDDVDNDE